VVAAKSQPSASTTANSQVRVVAPAAAVKNDTVQRAITAASARPTALPTIKVKPIKVHPNGSGTSSSKPHVVFTYKTTGPKNGPKKTVIVTVTESPSPSSSPSATHHEDGGDQSEHHHSHSPNPSASPSSHGGGDD
jgi:hypothetical protein